MNNASLHIFFARHRLVEFRKGERIVRISDPTDYLYLVKKGFVRQYSLSESGNECTVYLYKPGSCFFLPWIFGVCENTYQFEAMIPTAVWQAPRKEFFSYLLTQPKILFSLTARGYLGLSVLMIHIESLVSGNATQKVASALLILSKWFGRENGNRVRILLPITHRILSTIVGISRETTTVALTELSREGLLNSHGQRIVILDVRDLRKRAGISLDHFCPDEPPLRNTASFSRTGGV